MKKELTNEETIAGLPCHICGNGIFMPFIGQHTAKLIDDNLFTFNKISCHKCTKCKAKIFSNEVSAYILKITSELNLTLAKLNQKHGNTI